MAGVEEGDTTASITQQAYHEFAHESTYANLHNQHNLPLGPVYIRNFSLKKDPSYCGESSLKTAPNFASALLGTTIASKLRLDNSPSSTDINSTSTSSYVFKDVNALIKPGEGTLLLVSMAYYTKRSEYMYFVYYAYDVLIILTLPSLQLKTGTFLEW